MFLQVAVTDIWVSLISQANTVYGALRGLEVFFKIDVFVLNMLSHKIVLSFVDHVSYISDSILINTIYTHIFYM